MTQKQQKAATSTPKRKTRKRLGKRITDKRRAGLYGQSVRHMVGFGFWFGPKGNGPGLCPVPLDNVAKKAREAAHFAIMHRERYPRKGL